MVSIISMIVLGVCYMTRISCNKQEPTHDVILGNVYSQRLMQGLQPYSQLSDFITSVSLLNVSTLDNSTRVGYMNSTDNSINQTIQATQQYLKNQLKSTNVTLYNDSKLCITTQKSSKVEFTSFLQQPPPPLFGKAPNQSDPYPNDTMFSITEITFKQNPYKATFTFPYPNSPFQVSLLYVQNTFNISTLPLPLPYIFDTGMVYTGTSNDTANQAKLLSYTSLVTCLIRDGSSSWVSDGIAKQTLFHPGGKVLIQCNSNTSNLPVTIVNDTKYFYNDNPSGNVVIVDNPVYQAFYTAAMFWITIVVTLLWAIFIYFGHDKDEKTKTFVRQRSGLNKIMSVDDHEFSPSRSDTGKIDSENHDFQKSQKEIQNEEIQNSFVIQFDGDNLYVVQRKKIKQIQSTASVQSSQIQDVPVSYLIQFNDEEQQDQNIQLSSDEQLKLNDKIEGIPIVFYHYKGVGDNDFDQEVEESESLRSLNRDLASPALKPDLEKLDTKNIEGDGLLPPLNLKIFIQIFLRVHELYSTFYQYQKDLSRVLRFLISYCRTILILAFSSYIAQSLSLILNILVMLLGLIIANLVSHVAAIVLKHRGKLYRVLGIFVLALDLAIAFYIIITSLMYLLPSTHDVWMYTYIIITLIDWVLIELVVTGLKTVIQPRLGALREKKDNAIASIICVIFWDTKIQSIWRRTNRFQRQQTNQISPLRKSQISPI